jgi:pyruvate-formate lyase-activating enzyme
MNPAPRADFYRHMDAANVDLKAFTDEFYRRVCAGRLAPVLGPHRPGRPSKTPAPAGCPCA